MCNNVLLNYGVMSKLYYDKKHVAYQMFRLFGF